jgi:hypothetical protein
MTDRELAARTIQHMNTFLRISSAVAVLSVSGLLLTGCGAETMPMAPGPFGESPAAESTAAPETSETLPENAIDPGIEVPMDADGMSVAVVEPTTEPAPIPTININEAPGDVDQA